MIAFGHFLAQHMTGGDIFLLSGDLGAGKSTLARGVVTAILAQGGYEVDDIPSPTFTLVQSYPWPEKSDLDHSDLGREVWHMDLWRLEDPDEVIELGFEEALGRHAMLIEWPERLGPYWTSLSQDTGSLHTGQGEVITITISADSPERRHVTITPHDDSRWHEVLTQF